MTSLACIALAAYMEARQDYQNPDAMAAIAAVVVNRAEDHRYPDTPCSVIAEPGQFPWYGAPLVIEAGSDEVAWIAAQAVAEAELAGAGLDITSTHFHTPAVNPAWSHVFAYDGRMGSHFFYTNQTPYR